MDIITTTANLWEMNNWALTHGMNRSIDPQDMEEMDPEGLHLLTFSLIHTHRAGEEIEPHLRCVWLVKKKGTKKPETKIMDIDFDVYDQNVLVLDTSKEFEA